MRVALCALQNLKPLDVAVSEAAQATLMNRDEIQLLQRVLTELGCTQPG
jgi:hypothetical protein